MTIVEAQPQPELVRVATDLGSLIRKHTDWQEEHATLHEEVVDALTESGLLSMRIPPAFGGTAPDARTVVDVVAEIARADGSTGWTFSTFTIGAWLAGLLPDAVQDTIWADPKVRFCGSLGLNGMAVPVEGGHILNGRWHFNTGAQHAEWDMHAALLKKSETEYVPALVAVPVSDLIVLDDWDTAGLRGTGSVTSIAKDLFVPEGRVLEMLPLAMFGIHGSKRHENHQVWKVPFMQFAVTVASAPALGIARAAWDNFQERLPNRGITYTHYEKQNQAAITHLQVAEARIKIDEAEFHLHLAADRLTRKSLTGEEWTLEDRAAARMDAAAVVQRAKEAVDVLVTASGGSSIYNHVPMQRISRDINTLNLHGAMHPNTNAETYGRVLVGLEPNTDFI